MVSIRNVINIYLYTLVYTIHKIIYCISVKIIYYMLTHYLLYVIYYILTLSII